MGSSRSYLGGKVAGDKGAVTGGLAAGAAAGALVSGPAAPLGAVVGAVVGGLSSVVTGGKGDDGDKRYYSPEQIERSKKMQRRQAATREIGFR